MSVWPGAGSPKWAPAGRCFEHHVELQRCSAALLRSSSPGSSWRSLAEHHGSASTISATCRGIDPAPPSPSLSSGMGWRHYTRVFGGAAASSTTGAHLCPCWVLGSPHGRQAEEPFVECWNHWIRRYFCANVNQWNNKGISHLRMFKIGACVFSIGLTSILAALLIINTSTLTEPSW